MKKIEIIKQIYSRIPGIRWVTTERVVNMVWPTIADRLANGDRVELRGFGVFDVVDRKAKVGRNPKTGEIYPIAACRKVRFRATFPLDSAKKVE